MMMLVIIISMIITRVLLPPTSSAAMRTPTSFFVVTIAFLVYLELGSAIYLNKTNLFLKSSNTRRTTEGHGREGRQSSY